MNPVLLYVVPVSLAMLCAFAWAFWTSSKPLKLLMLAILFALGSAFQMFAQNGGTIYPGATLPTTNLVRIRLASGNTVLVNAAWVARFLASHPGSAVIR